MSERALSDGDRYVPTSDIWQGWWDVYYSFLIWRRDHVRNVWKATTHD